MKIQSESFKSNFWRFVAVVVVAGVLVAVDGPAGIRGASRWGAVMLLVSVVLTVGVVVAPKLVGAAKQQLSGRWQATQSTCRGRVKLQLNKLHLQIHLDQVAGTHYKVPAHSSYPMLVNQHHMHAMAAVPRDQAHKAVEIHSALQPILKGPLLHPHERTHISKNMLLRTVTNAPGLVVIVLRWRLGGGACMHSGVALHPWQIPPPLRNTLRHVLHGCCSSFCPCCDVLPVAPSA